MKYGDIKFYDKNFSCLAICPNYISVNWKINFKQHGSAEIHLPKTFDTIKLLTENKYLFLTQKNLQAVVTGYKIDTECVVFAKTPEWLLTKFLYADFKAKDVLLNKADDKISVSDLACLTVQNALPKSVLLVTESVPDDEYNEIDFTSDGIKDVHSLLLEMLSSKNMGFCFRFDTKTKHFIFKVLRGQKINNLIISDEYKTAYDGNYICDIQNISSGGIFYQKLNNGGRWDANSNTPRLTEKASNYGTYYTVSVAGKCFGMTLSEGDIILCKSKDGSFVKVSEAVPFAVLIPADDEGIFSWSKKLSKTNENDAKKELSEFKADESFSCKTKNLMFETDYNLGDIVKTGFVAEGFSAVGEKIVSAVHLWEESGDFGAIPTFEKIFNEKE